MMKELFDQIYSSIPKETTLVAVSKTKPIEKLQEAYDIGQRDFGENKVQELTEKQQVLPNDINWHFIGHLQRNKVKFIAPYVHLIHSVDSIRLLNEINKCANKNNRKISCLLQFHIAKEESKFGFSLEELNNEFHQTSPEKWEHINFTGVMGMATFSNNKEIVQSEFKSLRLIFEKLKNDFFKANSNFKTISMGMSQDYEIAIQEGSNMIRVGSALFGKR
ncbi:MAG: YggS family pyridoxal phosphate-dependent enzyme [Crocinitomicaceae bacterium]|nr:YggS family pyridoxal phosphate-dependent enzyme [Crocinitomicaceae bacterium]